MSTQQTIITLSMLSMGVSWMVEAMTNVMTIMSEKKLEWKGGRYYDDDIKMQSQVDDVRTS